MADITISVPDAAQAFAAKIAEFVGVVEKAFADGFQPGQDTPVILSAVITDLIGAAQSFSAAKEAMKADPFGSALALAAELKKAL